MGVDLKISSGLRGSSNILAMASAYNWSSLASSSKAAQVVVIKWTSQVKVRLTSESETIKL